MMGRGGLISVLLILRRSPPVVLQHWVILYYQRLELFIQIRKTNWSWLSFYKRGFPELLGVSSDYPNQDFQNYEF